MWGGGAQRHSTTATLKPASSNPADVLVNGFAQVQKPAIVGRKSLATGDGHAVGSNGMWSAPMGPIGIK